MSMTMNSKARKATTNTVNIDCSEIIDNFLFLGSAQAAKNLHGLQQLHVTHVLNLAGKNYHENVMGGPTYQKLHFEDCTEGVDLLSKLPLAFQFFDTVKQQQSSSTNNSQQKNKVFVHCSGGVSRSPSIVIAYVMRENRWTLRQSFLYVRQRRPGIKPNVSFMQQLLQFERELLGGDESANSIREHELRNLSKLN